MPPGHKGYAIVWATLFALFALGFVTRSAAVMAIVFFTPIPLGVVTYRGVDRTAVLAHRRWYQALVAPLLVSAAVTAVGSGMTMVTNSDGSLPVLGFLALGTTNVIVAILAWRALVRPSTRAAALAGMVAVVLELAAMVVDVMLNMHQGADGDREVGIAIALFGSMITIGTGALACLGALVTFRPASLAIPEARVVDGD
jgi:hypothetical protein